MIRSVKKKQNYTECERVRKTHTLNTHTHYFAGMGWIGSQIGRRILRNELDGGGFPTWLADHMPTQKIINHARLIRKMIMNNWQRVLEGWREGEREGKEVTQNRSDLTQR